MRGPTLMFGARPKRIRMARIAIAMPKLGNDMESGTVGAVIGYLNEEA